MKNKYVVVSQSGRRVAKIFNSYDEASFGSALMKKSTGKDYLIIPYIGKGARVRVIRGSN